MSEGVIMWMAGAATGVIVWAVRIEGMVRAHEKELAQIRIDAMSAVKEVRADILDLRRDIRTDLALLRKDITERS